MILVSSCGQVGDTYRKLKNHAGKGYMSCMAWFMVNCDRFSSKKTTRMCPFAKNVTVWILS
jgi:hypothetical protein